MPVTGSTLRVEGLASLQKHFAIIDKELAGDLRDGLKQAAEPVRVQAERLTVAKIGMGRQPVQWWQMRKGATTAGAYIAPARRRGRNPNLKRRSYRTTVLPRMIAALQANEAQVRRKAEQVVNRSIDRWGRG